MAYSAFPLPLAQCTAYLVNMAHTFVQNDVLYNNAGTLAKAKADNATTANVIGVVWKVINANSFVMVLSGWVNQLGALTANTQYYLSDATAGLLTTTAPSASSSYVIPVVFTDSTTSGYFRIGPVIDTQTVMPMNVVAFNTNMVANNAYAANAGGSINFVLPATYGVGAEFQIVDHSGNGFVITQTLGGLAQQVCDLGLASTAGNTGTVTTTVAGQAIYLKAIVANGALRVMSSKGTFVYA